MPRDEKDTIMKALTGALSKDSLKVLGISGVRVAKALPTELDTLKQHVDMLWQMDDGRLFHLEFQTNGESSLHRFLMYDARLAEQYQGTDSNGDPLSWECEGSTGRTEHRYGTVPSRECLFRQV